MNPVQEKDVVVNVFYIIAKTANCRVVYFLLKPNALMIVLSQILFETIKNDKIRKVNF
jgi:hypothetical protein